mmetsp:Transcript_11013/g.27914  ORF Transcript_11013/g.27914 Transcript_11013/m.27914 type:complete len:423 (-) Transcript_11013:1754-3022(-)
MAHKRQRQGDGDPLEGSASSSDGFLTLFGKESIHAIGSGNSRIARGGFGEVSIALKSRKRLSGNLQYSFVAIKTIQNAVEGGATKNRFSFGQAPSETKKQLSADVTSELLALKLLQPHPNIVSLLAVYPDHGGLSLAFDYCPMDLREVLEYRRRTFRQPLAFNLIQTIARDLFEALCHCHSNGILHRDLKPGNLLVSQKGVIQLCDFGLARPYDEAKDKGAEAVNNDKGLCTLYYRPPEVLLGGAAEHPSVDSWSAGVLLAELVTGRPLLPGRNVLDQLSLVYNHLGTPKPEEWPSVTSLPDYGKLDFGSKPSKPFDEFLPRACESPELVDLLSNLVVLNPSERFTAEKALEHDWLPPTSNHKELRDQLLLTSLQIPPLLFPENRQVVEKVGVGIAQARRSLLSTSQEGGNHWQELKQTMLR